MKLHNSRSWSFAMDMKKWGKLTNKQGGLHCRKVESLPSFPDQAAAQ